MKYTINGIETDITTIVSDLNGSLANFGKIDLPTEKALHNLLEKYSFRFILLTSDKRQNAPAIAKKLSIEYHIAKTGSEKQKFVEQLNEPFIAIGNARNDIPLFQAATLGIVVLGNEGLHPATLPYADIMVKSIEDALALIADRQAVESTLNQ